jgi:tetratricopeptide (TPR) repeat protein
MKFSQPSARQIADFEQAKALQQTGEMAAAAAIFRKLLNTFPHDPHLLAELGIITVQQSDFERGVNLLEKSLKLQPNQPAACFYKGLALMALQRPAQAISNFDQAIALKPDFAYAFYNRGNALQSLNRHQAAADSFATTIALIPDLAEAHNNLGIALQNLSQFEAALASFEQAVKLKPDYTDALNNLGLALDNLQQYQAAVAVFERAMASKPDDIKPYICLGNTLSKLKDFQGALDCFLQAAAICPDFADAHNNCGIALHSLDRHQAALACFDKAIALKPDYAEAYNNRGHLLMDLRQYQAALSDYERASDLKADFAAAYLNTSLLKLLTGDFAAGWPLYEWRWIESQSKELRTFPQPRWDGGQPVAGKSVLIYAEQGLGDFIQFCRYAVKLEELGAKVIIETPAALVSLCNSLTGGFTMITTGDPLPPFDLHCPIMSLPLAFKTTLDDIPAEAPYLYADSEKLKIWQNRLGNKSTARIGLVWSGCFAHKNDHKRSIPLELLKPLLGLPLEFHCLQKEIRPEDMDLLTALPQLRLHQNDIGDFSDTAALIHEMDLVVSIDSSVAHLGGALAKPVWILLPFNPDFRWLTDRADSPWYPTATLLRQTSPGDWPGVLAELIKKLARLFNL